jgi:LPXTG-site transpeptidase (sortase) family protein
MPNPLRGRRAAFALVGLAVVAVLAASGWFVASAHARPQTAAAHKAAVPSAQPSLLPAASAPPPTATPAPAAVLKPQQLMIPRIGVQAPIEDKGIDSDNQMEAPDKPFDVAWYPFTAKPGSGGNAVFAGHKDFAGVGPAVFWKLGQLSAGDTIQVTGDGQSQIQYQVTQTWDYTLSNIPMASVLAQGGGDQITLITCAGAYSQSAGYDHRLVVRAKRVA